MYLPSSIETLNALIFPCLLFAKNFLNSSLAGKQTNDLYVSRVTPHSANFFTYNVAIRPRMIVQTKNEYVIDVKR